MKFLNYVLYIIFSNVRYVYYMNNLLLVLCNGKVCSNGGILDLEMCECVCVLLYQLLICDEGIEFYYNLKQLLGIK